MTLLTVKVAKKFNETADVVCIELIDIDNTPLPAFEAGAHIDVHLDSGLIRQYSLCNSPDERHRYVIAVLRDPHSRGGSTSMHDNISENQLLKISSPRNNFPLKPAKHTLLIAGGIGITPIISMAEQLAAADSDFSLHYCTKDLERSAFHDRISQSDFAHRTHFYFSADSMGQRIDITRLLKGAPPGADLYVCGPHRLIDAVVAKATELNWNKERIHIEHFSGSIQTNDSDQPFEVKVASTGQVYKINSNQTITKILAENGVTIPVACEQGVCGTCITRITSGIPDHRDLYFTDEEHAANDQITPCCSRSKSSLLILDI